MPNRNIFLLDTIDKTRQKILRSEETIRRSRETLRVSREVQADRERGGNAKVLVRAAEIAESE